MNKKFIFFSFLAISTVLFFNCSGQPVAKQQSVNKGSKNPYHVMRIEQLHPIAEGSTIGVISGSNNDSLSLFIGAALESRGLVARGVNIYNIIPAMQIDTISPDEEYTFINNLIDDARVIITQTSNKKTGGEIVISNLDVNVLIDKLFETDDVATEKQRTEHYLVLLESLIKVVRSLNVDYILVVHNTGLNYALKMYDTSNLDIVFTNLIFADINEWRRIIPSPQQNERISYSYAANDEPAYYFELSYCEFIMSKLEVGIADSN